MVAGPSTASPLDNFKEHQLLLCRVTLKLSLKTEEMEEETDILFNVLSVATPARASLLVHEGVLNIAKSIWQTLTSLLPLSK